MADRGHDRADDTDELLYSDLNHNSSMFGPDRPPRLLDHCDLLLNAIDAQLGQLQVQPQKFQTVSREHDTCSNTAPLKWSQSLSKDTGLGSTSPTNDTPLSCNDLIYTPMGEQTSERGTGCRDDPVTPEENKQELDRRARQREEIESQREQVIWRLEKLLGDTCHEEGMAGEAQPASDSICTEDFVRCFRAEMVELTLPDSDIQQLDRGKGAERVQVSDCVTWKSDQREQNVLNADGRESASTGRSNKDTAAAHYLQPEEPRQRECLSDSYGEPASDVRGRYSSPRRLADGSSTSDRAEVVTEREILQHVNRCSPKARCLAGVPVRSFDTVSIDSDLDSVCTEQVRQHIHRRPGWRSLIESVTGLDDYCSNLSDCDTPTQEDSEAQSSSGHGSVYGDGENRGRFACKAQRNKEETYRLVSSADKKDMVDEMSQWQRRCRTHRTSEKMQSDWVMMTEQLSALQQKCQEEEEKLQLKKAELSDVELSLSDLQQKRKHALLDLERLTSKMEKEKRSLELVLRDRKAGKDSSSYQLPKLPREPHILEPSVVMSVLERQEMDRQLDSAKMELFAEQRRAREQLESMQEKLEETCEELQRVTEAERSLRSRCACMEAKQRQKKDEMEALELRVGKLQGELEECRIRVGTQERMLAQKELQLLDLQEQRKALQTERDGLKGELQHMQTQHCSSLQKAQEQTQRMVEAALKQQKRDLTLSNEQQIQKVHKQLEEGKSNALSLARHIESLKNTIQLKEEEARRLRDSVEQQKLETKSREERLHAEALEKVHAAVEEERRKAEAERAEAVQIHCGILEEQNRRSLESMRSEMQREKSKAHALQHEVVELQKKMQEVEAASSAQQREQESLLAVVCKSLKEEHQDELQKVHRQIKQERQGAALRLEQAAQQAQKETERLRLVLQERESSYSQVTAEQEQQLKHWAQQLGAECQHLALLMEQSGAKQGPVQVPPSSTVAEALVILRTLRQQMKNIINHLHQELNSQKQAAEELGKEKERELSIQRQQLRMERDQALDALKERLIQEHIEELSSLSWAHMCNGGAVGGGVAASLRRQLKAKDLELRQVQRSMAQWKEQTAVRLACKFEEELTAELERKPSKPGEQRQQECEGSEGEMTPSAKGAPSAAAAHSPSDVALFKLLRYLQSRVKQLRVENQSCPWSPPASHAKPLDLSGSSLTTVGQGQDVSGMET